MSPRICPPPPDCPLYAQRLSYAEDEPLRRAVLSELHRHRQDLPQLIRAEAAKAAPAPAPLPQPELQPLPISGSQKGVTHA